MQKKAILLGLLAGLLFGLATPISKLLLASISSYTMAGLLYFGAALVFLPYVIKNYRTDFDPALIKSNGLKLLGIIAFGGVLGPLSLLAGLNSANASSVSIWLNFELIAKAILGVLFFRVHLSKYALVGIGLTLASGIVISFNENAAGLQSGILIVLACFFWGVDNHLTAVVDGISSKATTFIKGVVGGSVNIAIGVLFFNTTDFLQWQSIWQSCWECCPIVLALCFTSQPPKSLVQRADRYYSAHHRFGEFSVRLCSWLNPLPGRCYWRLRFYLLASSFQTSQDMATSTA